MRVSEPVGEVEGEKRVAAGELGVAAAPVQTAGDHEMQDQPKVAVEADGDALADAAQSAVTMRPSTAAMGGSTVRRRKRSCEANALERLAQDAGFERGDIGGDVGQFGHLPSA